MTTKRSSSTASFARYKNRDSGTNVLAMKVPSENLERFRKIWKQPKAEAGDFIVKAAAHAYSPTHTLMTPERFNRLYLSEVCCRCRILTGHF